MRPLSLLVVLLLTSLTGCQRSSQPEPIQYSVPAEIESYIQSFRDEATKRKNPVSTVNLIVNYGISQREDVCGQCVLEAGKPPTITLNKEGSCWQQANQHERECLLFHELGHCLLKRTHKTDRFPMGAYISLMNPDNISIYATCRYPIGDDVCDKRPRRDYYVDELFDLATPAPDWAK